MNHTFGRHFRRTQTGATRGHTSPRAGPLGSLIVLAFLSCLLAACSSSPTVSASQKVCNDRAQLRNAVSTVIDDLRSGNFSKAKDDAPAVRDAVNNLSQSAQELKSEESQALRPEIDSLKAAITNLTNATSLSDLQSGFNSLKTQAQSINSQITETLKCS